jgi:hypothetical protein
MPPSQPRAEAMTKPSRAGGKAAEARPRKVLKRKGRKTSKAVTRRGSAPADPTEVARLTRERDEALEQQTATSEVLQVISSTPGDLQPVFAAMLEKAVRICDAAFGEVFRWQDDAMRLVATQNTPPAFVEELRRLPRLPVRSHLVGSLVATKIIGSDNRPQGPPGLRRATDSIYCCRRGAWRCANGFGCPDPRG